MRHKRPEDRAAAAEAVSAQRDERDAQTPFNEFKSRAPSSYQSESLPDLVEAIELLSISMYS